MVEDVLRKDEKQDALHISPKNSLWEMQLEPVGRMKDISKQAEIRKALTLSRLTAAYPERSV